jgi:biotin synthase-like enzyme
MGERLLTTPNPSIDKDRQLFEDLGIRVQPALSAVEGAGRRAHG